MKRITTSFVTGHRIQRQLIRAGLVASLLVFSTSAVRAAPSQSTQDRCTQYAQHAVAQYQSMKSHPGCRVPDGPRWQDNTDNHYKACMALPEFMLKGEESARDSHLRACGGLSPSSPSSTTSAASPSAAAPQSDAASHQVDLVQQPSVLNVPPESKNIAAQSHDTLRTDDQFTKAYLPNSDAVAPLIDLLTERIRNFSAEAALSLIDIRDFTFAFDRFDAEEGRTFSQRARERAVKHLQHKLASEDLLEPGTTAAQKHAIEEAIKALDGISTSNDARLAVALKQLIAKYRMVLRGELIFSSEQVVYQHAQFVRANDTQRIAETNKVLGFVRAASNDDTMKDLVLDLHEHDSGARDAQMASTRPRVGIDWDVPVDESLVNYTSLLESAAIAAQANSAPRSAASTGVALHQAAVPHDVKSAKDGRSIVVTVTGKLIWGEDLRGLFGAGRDLTGLPFRLEVKFTDTIGGALGSPCTLPYKVASRTPDGLPTEAKLTIGEGTYVFGSEPNAMAVSDRTVQGTTPHLETLFIRASEGPVYPNSFNPGAQLSTISIQMKTGELPPPQASCDWRSSVIFEKPSYATSSFGLIDLKPGGNHTSGTLLPERATIVGIDTAPTHAAQKQADQHDAAKSIFGVWTAKQKGGMFIPSDIEYTPTEQISNSQHWSVKYVVDGAQVTIIPKNGSPRTCQANGEEMQCQSALGLVTYVRLK